MPEHLISVTVTGVHDDVSDTATIKVDGITNDEASEHLTFEVPTAEGLTIQALLANGVDIKTLVDPAQVVLRHNEQASGDFRKTAEAAVAALRPTIEEDDAKILAQIQVVARAVSEHDAAIDPLTRRPDDEMFAIAQKRRASEAELNRLLTNRVNKLAGKIRASGIYD